MKRRGHPAREFGLQHFRKIAGRASEQFLGSPVLPIIQSLRRATLVASMIFVGCSASSQLTCCLATCANLKSAESVKDHSGTPVFPTRQAI